MLPREPADPSSLTLRDGSLRCDSSFWQRSRRPTAFEELLDRREEDLRVFNEREVASIRAPRMTGQNDTVQPEETAHRFEILDMPGQGVQAVVFWDGGPPAAALVVVNHPPMCRQRFEVWPQVLEAEPRAAMTNDDRVVPSAVHLVEQPHAVRRVDVAGSGQCSAALEPRGSPIQGRSR